MRGLFLLLLLTGFCSGSAFGFSIFRTSEYLATDSIVENGALPVIITNEDALYYRRFEDYIQTQLTVGYAINPKDTGNKHQKTNHAFEIGLAKSHVVAVIEAASSCYYLSSEFLINRNQFSIGPKVGANFFVWMFGIGTEFIYYTDLLGDNSLHWLPYIGIGLGAVNLRIAFHVPFYNPKYQDMNIVSFGFTLPVCTFQKNMLNLKNL